jgi:hypothetical protein
VALKARGHVPSETYTAQEIGKRTRTPYLFVKKDKSKAIPVTGLGGP